MFFIKQMGCTSSSKKQDENYYNKDIDEKRFLTGFHMSRGADGIETNFQIALCRK